MPKYTLPKPKKQKKSAGSLSIEPVDDLEWRRRVSLPVNRAIIDAVKAGQNVQITLTGEILGTHMSENKDRTDDCSIEVDLSSVSAYPEKEESPRDYTKRRMREQNDY